MISMLFKMELRDNSSPQQDSSGSSSSVTTLIQNITSNMSVFGYTDEYDPLKPNDYEKLKEQHKREQCQRDQELERQRRNDDEKRDLYDDNIDNEIYNRESNDRLTRKGNVFAPPPSLIEEDKQANNNNNNQNESGVTIKINKEKVADLLNTNSFIVDSKDEYPLPSSNSDEYIEDMEAESGGSNLGFGSTKGYFDIFTY